MQQHSSTHAQTYIHPSDSFHVHLDDAGIDYDCQLDHICIAWWGSMQGTVVDRRSSADVADVQPTCFHRTPRQTQI